MNNFVKVALRAMYQIFVVGMLLLPYRLLMLLVAIMDGFMIYGTGGSIKQYCSDLWIATKGGYIRRAFWVKYGKDMLKK